MRTTLTMARALLVATVLTSSLGFGTVRASSRSGKPKRVTLTILVTKRSSSAASLSSWGTVTYYRRKCSHFICGVRVRAKTVEKVSEKPVNKTRHPFRYWILPSGTKIKAANMRLTVITNETLQVVYKN